MTPLQRFDRLEKSFADEYVRLDPLLGSDLGRHDSCDSLLPDGSIERVREELRLLERWDKSFHAVPAGKLPPARRIDLALARRAIAARRHEIEEVRLWEKVPDGPSVIGHSIFQILGRSYAPLRKRMGPILERLEKLPKYLQQSRSKLRAPVKTLVEDQLETVTRLPAFFHNLKEIGRVHLPPTPFHRLCRLVERLQDAIEDYCNWLIIDVLSECPNRMGWEPRTYEGLLRARGVEWPPGRLERFAQEEIERLKNRLLEVSRRIRRKFHVDDMRSRIRHQHPPEFDGVLKYVREQVARARALVAQSGFASIPEGEILYVVEAPVYLRHFVPVASYWPPARFEEKTEGYLLISPGDCDSDKMREFSYPTLQGVAAREGYPGHHLYRAASRRGSSLMRALAGFPETADGWAHYAEERLMEMGLEDSLPSRFMQIVEMILRAGRVLLDVRLSTGRMTPRTAVHFLIDEVGMDRVAAEAEVRRYLITPGRNLASLYGKEQIKEIKKHVKDRMKNRFDEKFFHDAVLQSGALPFDLLREELEWRTDREMAEQKRRAEEEEKRVAEQKRKEEAREAGKPKEKGKPEPKGKAKPKRKPKPAAKTRPKPRARPRPKPSPKPRKRPAKKRRR